MERTNDFKTPYLTYIAVLAGSPAVMIAMSVVLIARQGTANFSGAADVSKIPVYAVIAAVSAALFVTALVFKKKAFTPPAERETDGYSSIFPGEKLKEPAPEEKSASGMKKLAGNLYPQLLISGAAAQDPFVMVLLSVLIHAPLAYIAALAVFGVLSTAVNFVPYKACLDYINMEQRGK